MSFRRAAKVDGNQAQIVKELRIMGFDVDHVHQLKKLYDLVVTGVPRWNNQPGYGAALPVSLRVEVKMPGEKLTLDEEQYWKAQNHTGNLIIAERTEDVLSWFGW